jgi:phage replication-related protein YjqB (UPF0714/DUF867 family)
MCPPDGYRDFYELQLNEKQLHYEISAYDRNSKIVLIAPHGGGIEPGTSELARAIAGDEFSFYCFEGNKLEGNDRLHITSTRFNEPKGLQMVSESEIAVAIHGCNLHCTGIFLGGLHNILVRELDEALCNAGFRVEPGHDEISGRNHRNICNLGREKKGVQLEISEPLRRQLFKGLTRPEREYTTQAFSRMVEACRGVLLEFEARLRIRDDQRGLSE